MARAGGVVPAPDMKTPRWSGSVVDDLVVRREQLLAAVAGTEPELRHPG